LSIDSFNTVDRCVVEAVAVAAQRSQIAVSALARLGSLGIEVGNTLAAWQKLDSTAKRVATAHARVNASAPQMRHLHLVHRDWIEQAITEYPESTRRVIAGEIRNAKESWLAQHFALQFPVCAPLLDEGVVPESWNDIARLPLPRLMTLLRTLGADLLLVALGREALLSAINGGQLGPNREGIGSAIEREAANLLPLIAATGLGHALAQSSVARVLRFRLPRQIGLQLEAGALLNSSSQPAESLSWAAVQARCT
jgi:hypothetical protein